LFPSDPDAINSKGYYIRTTLDPKLQSLALESLMSGLESYDRRHGWRGAKANVPVDSAWQSEAQNLVIPSERRQWRAAIVTSASRGGVSVEVIDGKTGTLASEDVSWAFAGRGLKTGDLILVEKVLDNRYKLKQIPVVNGAFVAVDPFSGRVVALVGGYSFSINKFNRAIQAKRQPGSSIKPFVYAAALEKDFTPASIIDDLPISFVGGDGKDWSPKNYENDFLGPQPLRRGIELSRNLMTVRLADRVGIKTVTQKIVEYGVAPFVPNELSAVLGAGEVTPYELTNAYSMFVNGGKKVKPHLIDEIEDRNGTVIYKADNRPCPNACNAPFDGLESPRIPALGQQIIDPISAYQVNSFMQGVVQRGTAAAARPLDRPLGGKTGTTNNYRSAWFVGFTADLVVGVYVGFDDNRTLGEHETGSVAALPIFINFVDKAYRGKPKKDFAKPKDAVFMTINGIEEAFKPGTEPKYTLPAPTVVAGPRPYTELWQDEDQNGVVTPSEQEAPKKKSLEDAANLY
jgi:penicillin-binding protein 1A